VHAAAAFDRAALDAMDLTVWRRVQAVNVESALLLSQAFAPGMAAARRGQPAAVFDDVRSWQALPRTLVPGDVAATVAFLASSAAAALTGQTPCVDGGLILR
jgi:NAD(P)-dependent dehydrogenase (short-subunit alcohol dehydrogenase family)